MLLENILCELAYGLRTLKEILCSQNTFFKQSKVKKIGSRYLQLERVAFCFNKTFYCVLS